MRATTRPHDALLFGQRLRQARERRRLTQASLAKLVDVSRTAITQWESAATYPSFERTIDLANCLDVAAEWLAFGTDQNSAPKELADSVAVPAIQFGDSPTERSTVAVHHIATKYIQEKQIPSSADLFFFRVSSSFRGYGAGSYLLVDGSQLRLSGEGDYLLWNGFGGQLVAINSNLDDANSVLVETASADQAQVVRLENLKIVGRVRGMLA